ncbi:N-terminal C2 in EEIG1 and EHBP1 proteins-domain-containing protein, partial [Mycena capillaripes]
TPPTGLRAQLHQLLAHHALFQVRIQIHQLASVPLVHGEFAVQWKFKNTHKQDGDGDSFGSAETSIEEPQTLSASASSVFSADEGQQVTSTRGQTPWLPLRDHSVSWDQPLSAVVQMSIDRDTHRLLPHLFKLKVVQRVIVGDPDAPHNPRLGVVELDLAEYADSVPASAASKGTVTRRYLLRDSKTNATLRLSIRVEPIDSPPPFIAPPLPNGEILAGVSTLLSTAAEVYRTRPHALNLYAPPEPPQPGTPLKTPFDIRALPRAYGPRPTESLIDAIFNPAPVLDERLVSPFTRLVAEAETPYPSPTTSMDSPSSSAPSFLTLDPSAGLSPEPRSRWWQRNRSRSRSRSRSRVRTQVAVA